MKRLAVNESLAEIGHLKNLLEQSGIACMIKNEQLSGALGEIPFLDCLPELWILDDKGVAQALRILNDYRSADANAGPWQCTQCQEINEGQFAVCWQCGHEDPQA